MDGQDGHPDGGHSRSEPSAQAIAEAPENGPGGGPAADGADGTPALAGDSAEDGPDGTPTSAAVTAGDGPGEGRLRRNLKARHVNLIAIGGAIGTGLFVGTGASISGAGPGGAVVSYGVIGVAIYFMMSALGQGLIISTLSKNQYVASFAALLSAFLPVVLLSGFIFELNSMPFIQRAIAAVLPARYLVTCLQTLFLAGDVWPLLLPNMIRLGLLGLFFLAVTLRYTKKVLA